MNLDKFSFSLKEHVDLLKNQNRLSEAVFCLEKTFLDSLCLLADQYFFLKDYEKAKFYFELLLSLNFLSFDIYTKLFETYKFLEDYEKCYEIASNFLNFYEGDDFIKFYNMGVACRATSKFDEAFDMFSKAIIAGIFEKNEKKAGIFKIDSKIAKVFFEKLNLQVCMGKISQSIWNDFGCLECESNKKFHMPKWDGCSIQNKTLLIYNNKGLGDFILYARFLPILKKHNCNLIFEAPEELSPILEQNYSLNQIYIRPNTFEGLFQNPPDADFWTSIEAIPQFLEIDSFEKIPTDPYIFPRNKKINFGLDDKKLKVGISWCGNNMNDHDWKRSIEFKKLLPLFDVPNVEFVNLSSYTSQFRQVNNKTIDYFAGREKTSLKFFKIEDFGDLIDIMENLDLVITVDTSVCHLAGAMGKNTWVLLGKDADYFPFTYNKEYSDWYPSMKMFRKKDTWESLIDQVKQELKVFKSEKNQ